jgi:tripartite-type tricarboxylate transporter receptor subunit TctC
MLTRRAAWMLIAASPWASRGFAQGRYPEQPVKLIVPFPGRRTDGHRRAARRAGV